MRSVNQVSFVKDPLSQTAKETRHPIFENFPSGAEQRRTWVKGASKTKQIIFISAGAMKKQQEQAHFARRERSDE